MTPELQKVVDDLRNLDRMSLEAVDPLVAPARAMSDDELVELLGQMEGRAIAALGQCDPSLMSRATAIIQAKEPVEQDDNRFERTYEED